MADDEKLDFSGFLEDYLNDARDGFQEINTALLALEKDHSKTDQLNAVFRVVHTLKGSSTMLEFFHIAGMAHAFEEFLDGLRKKRIEMSQDVIDLLFEVTDALEEMVREPRADWQTRKEELEEKIDKHTKEGTGRGSEVGGSGGTAEANPPAGRSVGQSSASTSEGTETLRVHADLLDSLFNLVGDIQ